MVGHSALDAGILVRIQVPQPAAEHRQQKIALKAIFCFYKRRLVPSAARDYAD